MNNNSENLSNYKSNNSLNLSNLENDFNDSCKTSVYYYIFYH